MTATAGVSLHPEAVDGEPQEVRWVIPAGTLAFVGRVVTAPAALQSLVEEGTVVDVVVEPTAIRTRLADGLSWRAAGERVRGAVAAAAEASERWAPATDSDGDVVLRAAITEVLDGDVGSYVRSHGGSLELVDVADGRVRMRFSGACAHCPASDYTLTHRFEAAVRARYPGLIGIDTTRVEVPRGDGPASGRRFIGIPGLQRR